MPNKKVSELPSTTTVSNTDIFVLNRLGTTSTITYDNLSAALFTNISFTGGTTDTVFDTIPIGTVCYFAASAVPVGYLECNGAVVKKDDYIDLYNVIKDTYTPVLSVNHFKLPDLRGEFIRGWDHGRGVDSGRSLGSNQSDALQGHYHKVLYDDNIGASGSGGGLYNASGTYVSDVIAANIISDGTNGNPRIASETRPRNITLLPCIKALKTVTGNTVTLNFIEKPASPTNGQVLTYNGSTSTWVASANSNSNNNVIGNSQTYQDVTSSRAKDTTYTNTTSKPILVCVSGGVTTGAGVTLIYKVDGITIGDGAGDSTNGGANYPFSFIVPVGSTYRVEGTRNLGRWVELR